MLKHHLLILVTGVVESLWGCILCFVPVNASSISKTKSPSNALSLDSPVEFTCETDSANPTAQIEWRVGEEQTVNNRLYEVTTQEVEGYFNAYKRRSTLKFTAKEYHNGVSVHCSISDQMHISEMSVLWVSCKYKWLLYLMFIINI